MMYLVAEFLHMVTAAFLIVDPVPRRLALLGPDRLGRRGRPGRVAVLRVIVLLAKVMGVILFFMLARWSWPRFRFDQLMDLGWKVMIPWGLVNVVVVAVWMEYGGRLGQAARRFRPSAAWPRSAGACWLLSWLVATVVDPDRAATTARGATWPAATSRVNAPQAVARRGHRDHETRRQEHQLGEEPQLGLAGKIVSAAVRPGADDHAAAPVPPQDDGPIARSSGTRSPIR